MFVVASGDSSHCWLSIIFKQFVFCSPQWILSNPDLVAPVSPATLPNSKSITSPSFSNFAVNFSRSSLTSLHAQMNLITAMWLTDGLFVFEICSYSAHETPGFTAIAFFSVETPPHTLPAPWGSGWLCERPEVRVHGCSQPLLCWFTWRSPVALDGRPQHEYTHSKTNAYFHLAEQRV